MKDDVSLRLRRPTPELIPGPPIGAPRPERSVQKPLDVNRAAMARALEGPETGRTSAGARARSSGSTGRTSEASLQDRLSRDFDLIAQRVLGRGAPIDKAGLTELLTAIDALDPVAQKKAIDSIAKADPGVAEALTLFRAAGDHERTEASKSARAAGALEHLAINTDAQASVPGPSSNVLKAASRYAKTLGIDDVRRDGHRIIARIGGKNVDLLAYDPKLSHAQLLREIGRALNVHRFGSGTVIPPTRVPFTESTGGYAAEQAYWSAQLSKLAYSDRGLAEAQARAWGFTKFEWIDDPKTDTQVMVVANDRLSVVAFRGSSSLEDFKLDAHIGKTEAHGGGVHSGFNRAVSSTWPAIERALAEIGGDRPVLFTGHSLGGGLATLAASTHAEAGGRVDSVYVHGCPRVGDARFAASYNERLGDKTFLHVNDEDIVTRLPPGIFGYVEVGRDKRVFDDSGAVRLESIAKKDASFEAQPAVTAEQREQAMRDMDAGVEAVRRSKSSARSGHAPRGEAAEIAQRSIEPVDDHGSQHYVRLTGRQVLDALL